MKRPNFFILGAPKCGTTSLAAWLSQHPNIYLSSPKEPNFFNTDDRVVGRLTLREYESLFNEAGAAHYAVGEASAQYLASDVALLNILEYSRSSPRFIICIRNPIEMAMSLHSYLVLSAIEDEVDFERAWYLQKKRRAQSPPLLRGDQRQVLYGPRCLLGRQLERVYAAVDRSSVHVVLLDDVMVDPKWEYQKVLHFLGVDDDGRSHFPIHNVGRTPTIRAIPMALRLIDILKSRLRIRRRSGFGEFLWRLGTKLEDHRFTVSIKFRHELREYFRADIKTLSGLLDRDLTPWLSI